MLVLAILFATAAVGGCALAARSAIINRNLSDKSVEWRRSYFETDADAKRYLLHIDSVLWDAEVFAAEYVSASGFSQRNFREMSVTAQEAVYERFLIQSAEEGYDEERFMQEAINTVYFYKAFNFLRERLESFYVDLLNQKGGGTWTSPDIHILTPSQNEIAEIIIDAVFYSSDFGHRLSISLALNPLSIPVSVTEISVKGTRDLAQPRYTVERRSFSAMPQL